MPFWLGGLPFFVVFTFDQCYSQDIWSAGWHWSKNGKIKFILTHLTMYNFTLLPLECWVLMENNSLVVVFTNVSLSYGFSRPPPTSVAIKNTVTAFDIYELALLKWPERNNKTHNYKKVTWKKRELTLRKRVLNVWTSTPPPAQKKIKIYISLHSFQFLRFSVFKIYNAITNLHFSIHWLTLRMCPDWMLNFLIQPFLCD